MKYGLKKIFLVSLIACCIIASGCARGRQWILTDNEVYYLIPAGTPFQARVVKDGPLQPVVRDRDSYNIEAGYLVKLQEEANAEILEPR